MARWAYYRLHPRRPSPLIDFKEFGNFSHMGPLPFTKIGFIRFNNQLLNRFHHLVFQYLKTFVLKNRKLVVAEARTKVGQTVDHVILRSFSIPRQQVSWWWYPLLFWRHKTYRYFSLGSFLFAISLR